MAISTSPVFEHIDTHFSLPVLMKEMRVRMRGIRAPILLFISTALTIVIGLMIIIPGWNDISANDVHSMEQVGVHLFQGIIILLGILCGLIAPALTAGSISLEREQQTLDLLLLTRLSNLNILFGKLLSALSFITMILLCAIPVVAISFLLGGVDPAQLCWSAAIIFITACFFSTIGLFCSTRFAKTSTAVATAYCICIASLLLLPLLGGAVSAFDNATDQTYYFFLFGASSLFAIYPTLILCALFVTVLRRPLHWLVGLSCWALSAVTCCLLLLNYQTQVGQAAQNNMEYFLIGNPAVALGLLIGNNGPTFKTWVGHAFLPLTTSVLLLFMLVMLLLTIGEFRRLRK